MQAGMGMSGGRNEQAQRQEDSQNEPKVMKTTFDFLRNKMSLVGVGILVLVAAVISSAYSH